MEKYRNWIIAGIVILIVAVVYFLTKDKKEGSDKNGNVDGCPSSFTVQGEGQLGSFVTTTYSSAGGSYFKQVSGQIAGASGALPRQSISKEEFVSACDKYKNASQNQR